MFIHYEKTPRICQGQVQQRGAQGKYSRARPNRYFSCLLVGVSCRPLSGGERREESYISVARRH